MHRILSPHDNFILKYGKRHKALMKSGAMPIDDKIQIKWLRGKGITLVKKS
jgi:hypothetical protein